MRFMIVNSIHVVYNHKQPREGWTMDKQTLLSARQAAAMLGVSKAYACRLFSKGVIQAEKVDTDWVVKEKDIREYLDDKAGIPVYYRNTDGWDRSNFYFLYRVIDKMVNDRRRRYDAELSAIETNKLSRAAAAMLKGEKAYKRFPNLAELKNQRPMSPPLIVSTYPSFGAFPSFEEVGIIL